MVVFDTETTGLLQPMDVPLEQQPQIIEFAAIKLDDKTLKEVDRMEFFANPGSPLPAEIVRITGITDKMLEKEKPFKAHVIPLADFFFGQRIMAAHNVAFDRGMLYNELLRLDWLTRFPWPTKHICTVEASYKINNKRINLSTLHALATGRAHKDAHRAMGDVEALCTAIRWLKKEGHLAL